MSYNIVHTDSGYVADYSLPNKEAWDEGAMNFLRGQEQKLYSMLGTNDFTSFMNKIHSLLGDAEKVKEVLGRFKKANLVSTLGLPENIQLSGQDIHIHFNKPQSVDFKKLLAQLEGIEGITVNSQIGTLDFIYNESSIKTLMNTVEERTGNRAFKQSKDNLSRNSDPLRTVTAAFKRWISNNENIGEVVVNGHPVPIDLTRKATDNAQQLFGFTKSQIQKALNEDPELKQQIMVASYKVYNTLRGLCVGLPYLEQIFDHVWENKIGKNGTKEALDNFAFLSKGGNLNAGVSGAVQEMYGALLTEYVAYLYRQNLPPGLAKIMGDIAEGGEQPKTDLAILNQIGIQIKAYGMNNKVRHIEANLHPNALDAQLIPYGAVNVGDAIVQSIFNTSNESPTSIASKLRDYGAALLNLATSKDLGINNTVCFYLIDAQYLVPGSKIIEAFRTEESKYNVKITSSYKGKSDSEWRKEGYHPMADRVRLSPNYLEYFDKEGTSSIHSEKRNTDMYQSLYTRLISIRTTFDYGFVGDSNIYSIF